jgi:hypothetical protein
MPVEQRGDAGDKAFLVWAVDQQYGGIYHAAFSLCHHLRWGDLPLRLPTPATKTCRRGPRFAQGRLSKRTPSIGRPSAGKAGTSGTPTRTLDAKSLFC